MYYSIEHEVPGRLRVRLNGVVRSDDVDPLLRVLLDCPAIVDATIYPRIGSIAVAYGTLESRRTRRRVLDYLNAIDGAQLDSVRSDYTYALATRTHDLVLDLACTVAGFVARRLFLPAPLDMIYALWQYRHFLRLAISSLGRGKLDVASLDAAAIGASFAQGDASTASETMFLLEAGEVLEDYTRAQSANELIYSLLSVSDLASRVERGQEVSVPATDLQEGDLAVVRTGQPVPIDGTVEKGVGMVNQAALTGEPLAVERTVGVTEWVADMLPEQKYDYVRKMRESGRRVVMVGDGVNDSPALKEANVGVAMAAGTAIAREVADITLTDSNLDSLVRLRKLSQGLMDRLDRSFWEIMLWNSGLLALGIGGVITPQASSLLHNTSTVALGTSAMRSYLS